MIPKYYQVHSLLFWLRTFLLVVGLAVPGTSLSQSYYTRTYNVVDGLPSSIVNDIAQDSLGTIWCATAKGICRYDGQSFKTFNNLEGKIGYGYSFIQCDEKGKLWTVSNYGKIAINVFDGKRWVDYPTGLNLKTNSELIDFEVFYEENSPVFAVATYDSGLFLVKGEKWTHFSPKNGLSGKLIHRLTVAGQTLYVATDNGISVIRNEMIDRGLSDGFLLPTKEVLGIKASLPKDEDPSKMKLWVMGKDWLGYIVDKKFTLVTRDFFLMGNPSPVPGFIYPDDETGVYFGNYFNLYHHSFTTAATEYLGEKNGLVGEGALSLFIDREKNIWIAGMRGISCIPYMRFSHYSNSDGLFDNEVTSALEISPGHYVFGHSGALTFMDGKKTTRILLETKQNVNVHEKRIQDMYLDPDKNLWIAASSLGLVRLDPSRQIKWYRSTEGLQGSVVSVSGTPEGKIYVSTTEGLFLYRSDRFTWINFDSYKRTDIRKIFPGENGIIYLSTYDKGLIKLDGLKKTLFQNKDNKHANNVFGFLQDSQKRTWVGTANGLYTIVGQELVKVGKSGCIIDRPVYLILEDRRGILWFGTDDGIYRWTGKVMNHFTVRDGISGPDVNRDAGFIDHQNYVWFGTNNGLTRFHQDFDSRIKQIPPPVVFIESLITRDDTVDLSSDIELSNDQNDLEFTFRGISFIDEKRVAYQCKLESFDQDWSSELSYSSLNYRYNNLPPGNYRFCVRAKNAMGVWSEPVYTRMIHIKHPFYRQWWFTILVFLVISFIGFSIFKFILSARYNATLEETVSIRTRELRESEAMLKQSNQSKDRFFSIIAHDLRSPFNSLLGYLDLLTDKSFEFSEIERRDILDKLKSASLRTLNLLDNLLSWARTQKGDMLVTPARINLSEIIAENLMLSESSATAKKIRLIQSHPQPFWAFADRNMVNTVVRNIISNAVKFTFPGGTITVSIRYNNDETEVCVNDTGCGISASNLEKLFSLDDHLATKGTNKEPGTGLGLILCHEFILLNKGKLWVDSEEGKGSRFCFTLTKDNSVKAE